MKFRLAQLNIAKMLLPIDSPVMAEFVSDPGNINALADNSDSLL